MEMLSAYVTNKEAYVAGVLIGKWVQFPIDDEDMNDIFCQIGVWEGSGNVNMELPEEYIGEDYFISDFDGEFGDYVSKEFGESVSVEELNDIAERLEMIESNDEFRAILEYCSNLDEALNLYESKKYTFYSGFSMYDIAYEIANKQIACLNCSESEKEWISRNFDYQEYATYLSCDNFFETFYGVLELGW